MESGSFSCMRNSVCKYVRNSAEFYCKKYRGIPYVFPKIPYSVGSQKRTSVDTLGPPPSPPPRGRGGGHWLNQAPAPFLLWSSQTHPPTLGSRDSACPIGVCRVSHWFKTSGTPLTYFPTSLFPLRSRHPVSGVVRERVGTLCRHRSPDDLGFVPNPGSMSFPPVTSVLCFVYACVCNK